MPKRKLSFKDGECGKRIKLSSNTTGPGHVEPAVSASKVTLMDDGEAWAGISQEFNKDPSSVNPTNTSKSPVEYPDSAAEKEKGKGKEVLASTERQERPTKKQKNRATTSDESATLIPKPPPKYAIKKLAAPRPFPSVPRGESATGPKFAHSTGKNLICVSRRAGLGAYLRRCKDALLKDGYTSLHLSAMGAAIPLLTQLTVMLPTILPHGPESIHTEITTGTVEVRDELIPEDEDDDIEYRTRAKARLNVVFTVDGDGSQQKNNKNKKTGKGRRYGRGRGGRGPGKHKGDKVEMEDGNEVEKQTLVYQEPEQVDMEQ